MLKKYIFRKRAPSISSLVFLSIIMLAIMLNNTLAESLVRSTSLQKKKFIEGNTERIDYVDENGVITDAADLHYATIIRTIDDLSITEEYYDSKGNPARQSSGYYAILREYNDHNQEYKTTYLGIDKQPIMTSRGFSSVLHSYNENNNDVVDTYLNLDSKPVESRNDGYGSCKKYDQNNRCYVIVHLDEYGEPMIAGNGYAMLKREFYDSGISKGKVKNEFYFDEHEKPVSLSYGQYGLYKEYDELGRNNLITYLDINGKATATNKGYATVKKTFYEDDSIKTEMYYDQDGNPFKMPDGEYGVLHQNGKKYNLNIYGDRYFHLKNILLNSHPAVIILCLTVILASIAINKKSNIVFLALYIGFILYMTVLRNTGARTGVMLEPLWSYKQFFSNQEIRWEIINNIVLFIPIGVMLYRVYPKKIMIIVPLLISLCVEIVQYITKTGLCEVDDIISNGLGGIIGLEIGIIRDSIVNRKTGKKVRH